MSDLGSSLRDRVMDLVPDSEVVRQLVVQAILSTFATGIFITGTAVFFTRVIGLSAGQVGIGLSIAGLVTFALSVPLGRLVDRVGAQRMWALGALIEALGYLAFPLARGFVTFVLLSVVLASVETASRAARSAYALALFPREERVKWMAFMRSAGNAGYTVGAGAGGVALAIGTFEVISAVPVVTAAILLLNAALVRRLPRLEARPVAPAGVGDTGSRRGALRNRGFVLLGVCNGMLGTNQVLLNIVVPLWLVERTDAPHALLAWMFGTNTVLAVALQVRAARGSETVAGSLRAVRRCAVCFVVSCLLVMLTHDTVGWVSIVLLWVGHITITGAELWQSASAWGFMAELSDPERRGDYQGVWNLGYEAGVIVGPAALTALAFTGSGQGWLLIAALAVVFAALAHPASRMAQAYLDRMVAADTAAGPA